jgi:urea transport system substrate-binding protein
MSERSKVNRLLPASFRSFRSRPLLSRKRLAIALPLAAAAVVGIALAVADRGGEAPIRVGILHSATGSLALSEVPVANATRLAIDELNARGGVLGRKLEVFELDGRSDDDTFAEAARTLLVRDRVDVIFGCWSSSCRKTLKPIVERHRSLLFYPVQYEGLESSRNIVYLGAAPNQQIVPAVKWFLDNRGRRFFLVGSDYIFPRAAGAIVKDYLRLYGGKAVGEAYVPLGGQNFAPIARAIVRARPDVILNTVNGASNIGLFRALRAAGIRPQRTPVVSFSVGEQEVQQIGARALAGNYAVWNYFASLRTPENRAFVAAYERRYGRRCVTDDPVEAAYVGVKLWAQAVRTAGSPAPLRVLDEIGDESYRAPEGMVYVDDENRHLWKTVRIGKILPNGQFAVVWQSEAIVHPVPFPPTRTRAQWLELLGRLHARWNGWASRELTTAGKEAQQTCQPG